MKRDMSKKAFAAALKRYNMEPCGFLGYVIVWRTSNASARVSRYNAGPRLRDQLAYLIEKQDEFRARSAA